MYAKFFVVALLASVAPWVSASPQPVAQVQQLEQRQNVGDIIDDFTSVAASVVTGDIPSVFTDATSFAGSVGDQATSRGAEIFTQVTSVGGQAITVITSVGGEAFTLASSGAGVAVSTLGSVFTIATAAAGAQITDAVNNNAALGMHTAAGLSSPAIVGLVAVIGSALLGAAVTL